MSYLTRRALLGGTMLLPLASTAQTQTSAPSIKRLEMPEPTGANADPLPIHLYRPSGWRPDGRVLIVMHGTNRDAQRYLGSWMVHAEPAGVLLVVPEFSAQKYPKRGYYNFGNVVDENLQPRPREAWTFDVLDRVFAFVRQATGAQRDSYSLYGHSAGAQFVHRYLLLAGASKADLIVSANSGSYTLPLRDSVFPWGLKDTSVSDEDLARAFARPVVVLLGEEDNDPGHRTLPSDDAARAQGAHRLARGHTFFHTAREVAASMKVPFRWRLVTVPGVGHSDSGMAPAAVRLVVDAGRA